MTLATKNGSLIVKDGKIAENCECCGDWFCYDATCKCPDTTITDIIIDITASDYLLHSEANGNKTSFFSQLSRIAGRRSLSKLSDDNTFWGMNKSHALPNRGGCTLCNDPRDIMMTEDRRFDWVVTLCYYSSTVTVPLGEAGPGHYYPGDTVTHGTEQQLSFVFGSGAGGIGSGSGKNWVDTFAGCFRFGAKCTENNYQWLRGATVEDGVINDLSVPFTYPIAFDVTPPHGTTIRSNGSPLVVVNSIEFVRS